MAKPVADASRRAAAPASQRLPAKTIPRERIAGARALVAVNKARKMPTEQWVRDLAAQPLSID